MFYKSNQMRFQVGGVSTLRRQTQERQYGDAAMLLQGLLQVLQHFEHYANIPQIKDMSTQLKQIQVSSVNFNFELSQQHRLIFFVLLSCGSVESGKIKQEQVNQHADDSYV
jgi:hypothetical protein